MRRVAARLPTAQLASLEGYVHMPASGDGEAALRALRDQLDVVDTSSPTDKDFTGAAFRTILFTDVVASTPLLGQLKHERMRAIMHDHDAVLQAAVEEHEGGVIRTIGDAFIADFAVPAARGEP